MLVVLDPVDGDASVFTVPFRRNSPDFRALNVIVASMYVVDAEAVDGLPPSRIVPGGLFSVETKVPPGQLEPVTTLCTDSSVGSYMTVRSTDPSLVVPVLTTTGILTAAFTLTLLIGAPLAAPRSTSPTSGSRFAKNVVVAVTPFGIDVAVSVTAW